MDIFVLLEQSVIIYIGKFLQGDLYGPTTSTGIWAYAEYFSWAVAIGVPVFVQELPLSPVILSGVIAWFIATLFGRVFGYIG